MARRSSKEILDAARQPIEALADRVQRYERFPGIRQLTQHFISPNNDGTVPPHLRYPYFHPTHPWFSEAMARARDAAIFRLWGRSRVVYAMDDDLLGYLSESAVTSIPTEILKNIPHANPYVLLPAPDLDDPETVYYRTHIGIPWGAFVFGRYRNAELLCSTNDERREDLGLMFLGFVESEGETTLQTIRCTVPLRERTLTIQRVVDETIARFTFNEHLPEGEQSHFEAWLRRYVSLVFNSLVYICTDQPDVETNRPGFNKAGKLEKSARRQQRRPRPSDITEVVKLGFRLGPALFQARERWQRERTESSTQAGVRQPPHQRRGHFHTYWTGPGRQVPRLNWVAPYWVSQDLLGDQVSRPAVVRRVRKRS